MPLPHTGLPSATRWHIAKDLLKKKEKKDKISFYLDFGSAVLEGFAERELCRRCLCSTGSSVWKGKVPVEG